MSRIWLAFTIMFFFPWEVSCGLAALVPLQWNYPHITTIKEYNRDNPWMQAKL